MSAKYLQEIIYIDSSSLFKFSDFWHNTLCKGYLKVDDILSVSPTAFIELRTTFILTFLFFFIFFWCNYFFLSIVVQPSILMKKKTI